MLSSYAFFSSFSIAWKCWIHYLHTKEKSVGLAWLLPVFCFSSFFILWLGLPRGHSITTWTRDGGKVVLETVHRSFLITLKEIHSEMSTRGRSDMIGGQEVAKFGHRSLWTPPCSISPRVALGHQSSPPFMTSIIDQVSPHKVLFIKWLLSTMFKNWNTSGNPVTFWLDFYNRYKTNVVLRKPRGELSLFVHIHIS